MWPWLKHLIHRMIFDESVAERAFRATGMLIGQALVQVPIPWPGKWQPTAGETQKVIGWALTGGSLFVPAGDKNPKATAPPPP